MNTAIYHILNGDALREQFPDLPGELLVAREALVDGDVAGESPEAVYASRARYMAEVDEEVTEEIYVRKSAAEFEKMRVLPSEGQVYLWFERDLFCQVNLWFVTWLLAQQSDGPEWFLVLPTADLQYGFGGMSKAELAAAYAEARPIPRAQHRDWAAFWPAYQAEDLPRLQALAAQWAAAYPFLGPAVAAHTSRFPEPGKRSGPEQLLWEIMQELQTDQFGPVFQQFCRRGSIYGFGDIQVHRMWQQLRERG